MSKQNTIGVAFLGLGRMGETHLQNLTAISGVKVVVVADPARERAERGRAMTGAELALTEPEKAIDHPSVDVVINKRCECSALAGGPKIAISLAFAE
jgi:predicted dehydrogenase